MATLETQYKSYLINNPDSKYTYREWLENVLKASLKKTTFKNNQINDDELKDWDNTLLDGLDGE